MHWLVEVLVQQRISPGNLCNESTGGHVNEMDSIIRDVGMKVEPPFFHSVLTNEDIVTSRFLPDVVEEDQFFHVSIRNLNQQT